MKKILAFLFVFLLSFPVFVSAEALTGSIIGAKDDASDEAPIARLSNNVSLYWLGDSTAYAIKTAHESGTNVYGTAHDSTSIYRSSEMDDAADPGASDSSEFDGWAEL